MIDTLISWLLPDYPGWLLVYIYGVFLVGGIIKGFIGVGLPAVLMVMLTVFLSPVEAIPLIALPMLFINMFQYFSGKGRLAAAREYWLFAAVLIVVIYLVSSNIRNFPESLLLATLGFVMVVFALNTLFGINLRISASRVWHVVGGIASGLIGGLAAVWSPPVAMYLIARDVKKDAFITISGLLFMVGCFGMTAGLGSAALITGPVAGKSIIGFVVAIAGFRIGESLRGRIGNESFRKFLLAAFLIMGVRLIVVSVL